MLVTEGICSRWWVGHIFSLEKRHEIIIIVVFDNICRIKYFSWQPCNVLVPPNRSIKLINEFLTIYQQNYKLKHQPTQRRREGQGCSSDSHRHRKCGFSKILTLVTSSFRFQQKECRQASSSLPDITIILSSPKEKRVAIMKRFSFCLSLQWRGYENSRQKSLKTHLEMMRRSIQTTSS